MKKRLEKRSGFTLVELLIVIAIIAVLSAVGIVGYSSFKKKAYISNDTALVAQLNLVLNGNEVLGDRARCMSEALEQICDNGFIVETLEPETAGYHFVYDQVNNRIALVNDDLSEVVATDTGSPLLVGDIKKVTTWLIVNNDKDYNLGHDVMSIYLGMYFDNDSHSIVSNKGIDGGKNILVTSLEYNNTTGNKQEVILYTNTSQALTVKAKNTANDCDTVNHYGDAKSINIVSNGNSSYHEFGGSLETKVAQGAYVAEAGSIVSELVIKDQTALTSVNLLDQSITGKLIVNGDSTNKTEVVAEEGSLTVELTAPVETNVSITYEDGATLNYSPLNDKEVTSTSIKGVYEENVCAPAIKHEEAPTSAVACPNGHTWKQQDGSDVLVCAKCGAFSYEVVTVQDTTSETINVEVVEYVLDGNKQIVKDTTIQEVKVVEKESNSSSTTKDENKDTPTVTTCSHEIEYVDNGSSNLTHYQRCKKCGERLSKDSLHVYDSESAKKCMRCGYNDNQIVYSASTDQSTTYTLSTAIAAYNANTDATKDYIIELEPGIYEVPVGISSSANGYVVNQTKLNKGSTLTIKAKNMSDATTNWNVILKPTGVTNVGNQYVFAISGCGGTENGGAILFKGLSFDFSDSTYATTNYSNARIFGVYCLPGADKYSHEITVDNCKFLGCGGKFASAVGANENNNSPSAITISNCIGDKLNCWFNGYIANHSTFGLKLKNLTATNFLVVMNKIGNDGTLEIDNVDGSFLYDLDGDGTSSEKWLMKTTNTSDVTVKNCTWTLLSKARSDKTNHVIYKDNNTGTFDITTNNNFEVDSTKNIPDILG